MALAFESPRPRSKTWLARSRAYLDSPGTASRSSVAHSPKTPMKHLPQSVGKPTPVKTPKRSMKAVPSPQTPVKTSRKDKAVTCAAIKKVVKTAIQKPKNKTSVLKKPASKQVSAKAKCSAMAKVQWIQDEQLFQDVMDQCYMEYEDDKGYNESYSSAPCTWTQLLIAISDIQLLLLLLLLLFWVYGWF